MSSCGIYRMFPVYPSSKCSLTYFSTGTALSFFSLVFQWYLSSCFWNLPTFSKVGCFYIVKEEGIICHELVVTTSKLSSDYFNTDTYLFFNLGISVYLFQWNLWSKWDAIIYILHFITTSLQHTFFFYSHTYTRAISSWLYFLCYKK